MVKEQNNRKIFVAKINKSKIYFRRTINSFATIVSIFVENNDSSAIN